MLGHQLLRQWAARHEVHVTLRGKAALYGSQPIFRAGAAITDIDVRSTSDVERCIGTTRPEVIINAVGLVKQRSNTDDCTANMQLNSLFPHQLAYLARKAEARLVHFSTDCVFSGRRGMYSEQDLPDAQDLYGRSKLLGETYYRHTLTLRTSIIGRELSRNTGLLEWFLAQRAPVKGYRRAIYSGFTTIEMARIVERLLVASPTASGVWHVSSAPVNKYDLLCLVRQYFKLDTDIAPDDSFVCDRSLDSNRFRSAFGYVPPSWEMMIQELANDRSFYE